MHEELQVKGSSVLSKLAFTKASFGDKAEAALREMIEEAGVRHLLAGSWYPYTLFVEVLESIARRHYGGNLRRLTEVGDYSARHALTTTYDFFARLRDPARFLSHLATLHGRFYSAGSLGVEHQDGATACVIQLSGMDTYADADLFVAQGFYAGAIDQLGFEVTTCHFDRIGDGVRFDLAWRERQG